MPARAIGMVCLKCEAFCGELVGIISATKPPTYLLAKERCKKCGGPVGTVVPPPGATREQVDALWRECERAAGRAFYD